jgi:hypothetical protein
MGHAETSGRFDWSELDELVTRVQDARRAVAAAQSQESRLLAAAVDLVIAREQQVRAAGARRSQADLPLREVSAELAAAMRLSDRSVQRRMGDAAALVTGFPATLAAWEGGHLDAGHVAAIIDAGVPLSAEHRARFERVALDAARSETAGRMQEIARVIAARVDPKGAADRIAARKGERRVRVIDLDDGMARLLADLPATLAYAIYDRLTRMAVTVRDGHGDGDGDAGGDGDRRGDAGEEGDGTGGERREAPEPAAFTTGPARCDHDATSDDVASDDTRRLDEIRADVLTDVLLGGAPVAHGDGLDAVTGHVQVTVPLDTLAGASSEPALLTGAGPVDADTARRLAGAAPGWDRVLTDPHTGAVLAVDRYRPGEDLRRHLRARGERCRFPGCRRQARGCDLDHTRDAALGGPTCVDNLCHLCRRHHTLKHASAWRVRQLAGGVIEWRSPLGRLYQDRPPAIVRFVPSVSDPPPF